MCYTESFIYFLLAGRILLTKTSTYNCESLKTSLQSVTRKALAFNRFNSVSHPRIPIKSGILDWGSERNCNSCLKVKVIFIKSNIFYVITHIFFFNFHKIFHSIILTKTVYMNCKSILNKFQIINYRSVL